MNSYKEPAFDDSDPAGIEPEPTPAPRYVSDAERATWEHEIKYHDEEHGECAKIERRALDTIAALLDGLHRASIMLDHAYDGEFTTSQIEDAAAAARDLEARVRGKA